MSGLILAQTVCKSKINYFFKTSFRKTIGVSNSLDLELVPHHVGPDLGPNSLRKLSADDTRRPRLQIMDMNEKQNNSH